MQRFGPVVGDEDHVWRLRIGVHQPSEAIVDELQVPVDHRTKLSRCRIIRRVFGKLRRETIAPERVAHGVEATEVNEKCLDVILTAQKIQTGVNGLCIDVRGDP